MNDQEIIETEKDEHHAGKHNLETFKILFYIKAILNLLFCLIPLVWAGMFSALPQEAFEGSNKPPFDIKQLFLVFGSVIALISLAFAVLTFMAGRYIHQRKNRTFIFVMAILNCFSGILGILLGIFTLIELEKPHVRKLFESGI